LATYRQAPGFMGDYLTSSRRVRTIATAALLLISAYFLAGAGNGYGSHNWHEAYGDAGYFSYVYSERVRFIVCGSWILAAVRFGYFRWFPVSILALVIAWLLNPIVPVVTTLGLQPYYRPTMILSVAAAVALAALTYKNWRVVSE
jgi:hypothetical protein